MSAEETRRLLLLAAAAEFDRNGYAGTSLTRAAREAGVTLGALTFHFSGKSGLAQAVGAEGAARTREELRAAPVPEGLPGVVALTGVLARLLEGSVLARAAARLAWEHPDCYGDWDLAWPPPFRTVLTGGGALPDTVPREGIATLVRYLVPGTVHAVRTAGREERGCAERELAAIWSLVRPGGG